MTDGASGRIDRRILLSYALPAFVVALPTIPVYIHLPALYGIQSGLGLATTGLVLLLARLFDAVTDPLVGALSDRFSVFDSHRKPWIAVGAVIAGFGLYKVLNPPAAVDGSYLFAWSIVLYAGWTMVSVPYLAWGAELSPDYNERTRITSWREGLALLGILAAGALGAATAAAGWTQTEGAGAIAWLAIALGAVFISLLIRIVPEPPPRRAGARLPSLTQMREELRSLFANRPFRRLLAAWFLNGLANAIPAALFFVYLEHGLGAGEQARPAFILAYFLAAVASIPLWPALSRRFGKHRVWCSAMIGACIAFAIVPFLAEGQFAAFAVVCVVTGIGLGADLVLPPAIQSDVVDYDELRSGRARAGLQFACWGLATKLAMALAVGLALPAVTLAGFDAAHPTDAGKSGLTVIYALVPVVIKLSAIAAVWRFPLTAEKHAIIGRRLTALRARRSRTGETAT